ncbi:MAG TPA: hypothetical protein VMA73_08005 [Streptosporangiaceae bacterium]|nr:hypothetical protein [Streptosporangiaceae bacterium]
MWRRRRRLQQLETEVAQGRAERAELRRRLDWFETIAAAAGAVAPGTDPEGTVLSSSRANATPSIATPSSPIPSRAAQQSTAPSASLPPRLLAAARDLRGHDVPVRLEVAGAEVIAVVGGPGDPEEWWRAIWQTAGPDTADAEEAPA